MRLVMFLVLLDIYMCLMSHAMQCMTPILYSVYIYLTFS